MIRHKKLKGILLPFLLTILPVAYIYATPGIGLNLGVFLLLLVIYPLAFYRYLQKEVVFDKSHKKYIVFASYIAIISLINGCLGNLVFLFLISVPLHILLTGNRKIYNNFLKLYIWLSFLFSFFLIVQDVSLLFFSKPIEGLFSFLPKATEVESSIRDNNFYTRISSVFTEPSHFALYVIPSVCILLWKMCLMKYRLVALITISAAVLLSTSGNGIVLIIVIYLLYIVHSNVRKFSVKSIAIGIAIVIAGIAILNTEVMQLVTDNLFSANTGDHDKSEYRIKRGFNLYSDLPVSAQFLGVGWGNAENYTKTEVPMLYSKYYISARFDYFNSIAGILIYSGIVGFSLFAVFFLSLFKKTKSFEEKTIIFVILLTMVSSSIFMAEQWLFYLMIIYSTNNKIPVINK